MNRDVISNTPPFSSNEEKRDVMSELQTEDKIK